MPVINVPGFGPVNFPDTMTDAEIVSAIRANSMNAKSQIDSDSVSRGAKDFADDSGFGNQVLTGVGKRFSDLALGAKQMMGFAGKNAADEKKALDKPLMDAPGGSVGSLAADLSLALPMMGLPALGTVGGAAAVGGGLGALNPIGEGDSRLLNTGIGAGLGAAGAGVGNLIGRLAQPAKSALSPEAQALAQKALKLGIPLDAAAVTGSKPLQTTNAVLSQLPFTAGREAAKQMAVQEGFTNAALGAAGMSGRTADPVALAAQKTALGGELERIASQNQLDFNGPLINKLSQIYGEAAKRGDQAAKPIHDVIDNILKEVPASGVMGGQNYQAWRQMLRPLAKGGGADSHSFGQIRSALDDAFNTQIQTTGGAQAWNQANRQYGNLKTIMEAAGGAGNQAAQNQIAPSQLSSAFRNSVGKENNALGRGDLNDLSRIGQLFVKEQTPNSGTAQRAQIQSLLTLGGAGILGGATGGAGGYAGSGGDPWKAAAGGAAGLGVGLAAPYAAQSILNNPLLQQYLIRTAASPVAGALSEAAARTGGMAGVLSQPRFNQ